MKLSVFYFAFNLLSVSICASQEMFPDFEVDHPKKSFRAAMSGLRELRTMYQESKDSPMQMKMKLAVEKISVLVKQLVSDASNLAVSLQYSQAAIIISEILEHESGLLDKKTRMYMKSLLINYRFREALVGNQSWASLVDLINQSVSQEEIETEFDYYLQMGKANELNEKIEKEMPELLAQIKSPSLLTPYVLSFELPQYAQTPSIGHFGHAMLDGLWPFIIAFTQGKLSRISVGAPVYVLDIGLYILPLLRTVFPSVAFVPFSSLQDLPQMYEIVQLKGPGMARFGNNENPFVTAFGKDIMKIRNVVYDSLNITAKATCIVLLSRQMDPRNLENFHSKSVLDRKKESPFLRTFHNAGEHVYTAMHYSDSTAHERRAMKNEMSLFKQMSKVFNKKYGICVKLVQLDKLSIREQFETFATAKLVIAQHGAGLTYTPFLPNKAPHQGIVLELNPQINPNFKLACEAMGVRHHFLHRAEYPSLYTSNDDTFIEVAEKQVIKIIMSHLVGWAAPEKGEVWDLSASPLSAEALKERSSVEADMSQTSHRQNSKTPLHASLDQSQECFDNPDISRKLGLPEVPYIKQMIARGLPFVWLDSGFSGVGDAKLPWAGVGRNKWEASMRRVVYEHGLSMPQKIMASPSNVFDIYDTYTYDVTNMNPGKFPPAVSVDAISLEKYRQSRGPFEQHALRYVHFQNRSIVTEIEDFVPIQRQVSGPPNAPDIGFRLMDPHDNMNLSHTQPIIASGEKYYLRYSGSKGQTFYDIYAPFLFPAAFNKFRSLDCTDEPRETTGGDGNLPSSQSNHKINYSYGKPRDRHEIVSAVDRISIFFSTKGAVTNLHYDQSGVGAVVCQLKGSKRFQLWPPGGHDVMQTFSSPAHPLYRRSRLQDRDPQNVSHGIAMRKAYDLLVEEGMCIFFPNNWWHYVESLDDDTISTRFTIGMKSDEPQLSSH